MHIIQVSWFILLVNTFLIETIHASLSEQLYEILKRLIQTECNCSPYHCCSKWGYCGLTDAYCGDGCQSGPCKNPPAKPAYQSLITSDVFNCIFSNVDPNIRQRRFQGLISAMKQMNWTPINKVEAAIFLAHISYETNGLKTLTEDCIRKDTCNNYQASWCSIMANPERQYYGRGMLQIFYPCHYYAAGKALGLDLLNNPDLVSQSDRVAAATAIWYYRETGMDQLAQHGHFSDSTRRLNKYHCSSKYGYLMQLARVKIYQQVRKCFSLPETSVNLIC